MRTTTSAEELDRLLSRDAGEIRAVLEALLAERAKGTPDARVVEALVHRLGRSIYATQVLSALFGARRVVLELDSMTAAREAAGGAVPLTNPPSVPPSVEGVAGGVGRVPSTLGVRVSPAMAGATSGVLPRVQFEEAVASILSKHPEVGGAYRAATAAYSPEAAFTMAKAVDAEQVARVRDAIGQALREGRTMTEAREAVLGLGDWSAAYADTVYSNAVARAYAEGRLAQAKDPDVRLVAPAVMVQGVHDANERVNHRAYVGLVAAPDDPIWAVAKPPYGHRCRHGLRLVDRIEAESLGILDDAGNVRRATLPPGAHPDPGWVV